MPGSFPFSALVGQDTLKRALLLNVIQPSLGGVLIRGTKGVAKSTAVRALAGLLPRIETLAGCPFQRRPGEAIPDWPLPADAAVLLRRVPLVELPLGATEDRVLGSLHLERALRGERVFEPGLLAAANRGILYIDEVNLLPDHLVDVLLDAAAGGVHRVEREGLSLTHPARFVLIGTMNPEEGELRPQLLDRFGLVVDVTDLTDPHQRAEAVRRRLAFEADPEAFAALWSAADAVEAERLLEAQRLLPRVRVSDDLLRAMSERCLAAGVEGLRADLTLTKAASAWAAYNGRLEVTPADVDAVAELALAHRRTRPPEPPPERQGEKETRRQADRENGSRSAGGTGRAAFSASSDNHFESAGLFTARARPPAGLLARATLAGRWRTSSQPQRGRTTGEPVGAHSATRLAWAATLRAAAPYQVDRHGGQDRLVIRAADLRFWPRRGPAGCLLLFVIDASGSMGAWQRMRQTKAAVLALLVQAYQRRDRVALLTFRGETAKVILPPSRGLRSARQALEGLVIGGTTPLAHGLAAAARFVRTQQRRQPRQPIWAVLLTDGRSNVPSVDSGVRLADASPQLRTAIGWLQSAIHDPHSSSDCLVVDTETGWPRLGRARELAGALGVACLPLEEVLGRPVRDCWPAAI